jgi:REP element-mobilizing transposase RayT
MHQRFGIEIHAYCLMDNHYHLLVRCPRAELSNGMQRLGAVYARHVNDRVGRDGPLFGGRFKSRLVLSHRYITGLVRYIHRNALDLPGVTRVDGYRWSSHRSYIGARREPDWLFTGQVLGYFGGDRNSFHSFVSEASVGTSETATSHNVSSLMAAAVVVAGPAVLDAAGASGLARTLVLLIIDELPREQQWPLAAEIGIQSKQAHRMALSRARAAQRDRPEVGVLISATKDLALRPLPLAA